MNKVEIIASNRPRVCRLCNQEIERNAEAMVMRKVHVSAKRLDLWFHINCVNAHVGDCMEAHIIKRGL